ncbi:MAG: hypothetical protein HYV94_03745 [Candidatus Rokubacteria bacterium]|nr:hypothetical protein [Candidatus Rokubacteria bacterium]
MAKAKATPKRKTPQEEKVMIDDPKKAQELFGQLTGKAVETMTVWADANQRVLREVVELGAATAKEGVRLYAELQQSAIEAMRDSQAAALRWPTAWQNGAKDPVELYQKALVDSVDGAQKAFKLLEGQAQAFTRSAERLQTSAEQAGKGIQETYTTVVSKVKDVYSQN